MRVFFVISSIFLSKLLFATNHVTSFQLSRITTEVNRLVHNTKLHMQNGLFDQLTDGMKKMTNKSPTVKAPDNFVLPEPKPLTLTRPSLDFFKACLPLGLRLGTSATVLGWKIDSIFDNKESDNDNEYSMKLGPMNLRDSSSVLQYAPRPIKKVIIYEYDGSPYCQRVREMVNILDLTVEYRPCPGARQSKFSQELLKRTGKQTVPYMIDENTGTEMFESNDIIDYLLDTYGPPNDMYDRKALWPVTFEPFAMISTGLTSSILNFPASQRQSNARNDNEDMKPIIFYGYEASPFCRSVREKLCKLALPHTMVSCSRGSMNRSKLLKRLGAGATFQVPYIIDPNTGIEMFESNEICDYLDAVYTTK